MATASWSEGGGEEGEEQGRRVVVGKDHLSVEDDLREMTKKAAWSVSTCKPGNGVSSLRDTNLDTYWQERGRRGGLNGDGAWSEGGGDEGEGVVGRRVVVGKDHLSVEDDLREMTKKAAWSVSTCKPGNGVSFLRDTNLDTYWQSDGAQPHHVNIQFQKKVKLQLVVVYVDFKLDESYTPSKITVRAGDGFHNLKEIKTVDLAKPTGWVYISLSGNDARETFVNAFMLQISVLANHLNGRDTHVRQIKVYGPRPNPIPHQPFHFTSPEFITYSTVR